MEGVAKRYPNVDFPQARIMVNPVIIQQSAETQVFNHACLSVPCTNRCAVESPFELRVAFQDPNDGMNTKDIRYTGINAVVLWHELMHILQGKTYMDEVLQTLSAQDLLQFKNIVDTHFKQRQLKEHSIPDLTTGPFQVSVFIDNNGEPKLNEQELKAVLPRMNTDTVVGLLNKQTKY